MDKRLIFRYRSRTIQSQTGAGWVRPSTALELPCLRVQLGFASARPGKAPVRGQFGSHSPPRKARLGMPRAPVPQTDTGGRA
jgi:hypothetical protein